MLVSLSIRDIVLIDRLDISFQAGLGVLTGETGAGKSILLDALGLALGERGETGLVRRGCEQGSVTAAFEIDRAGDLAALLTEHGIPWDKGEPVILRRTVASDGRSRAYVNDSPVSVGLLRQVGQSLAEIQVQSESHRLLAPARQRQLLDAFAGNETLAVATERTHAAWRLAQTRLTEEEAAVAAARADEEFLRHAVGEFVALDPAPDEEDTLARERELLRHGEKVAAAITEAEAALSEGSGIASRLRVAERALQRVATQAGGRLDAALAALERANNEAAEAVAVVEAAAQAIDLDPRRLEALEERLFALRALARKHRCQVSDLAAKWAEVSSRLAQLDDGSVRVARRRNEASQAREAYRAAAAELASARRKAAQALDRAVAKELPPLHLGSARFRTVVEDLAEPDWGAGGTERIAFEVATNPGQQFAGIARIASGGELSRFMLALQVVLAGRGEASTLIFDEADSGVGGAVADAVGERLSRLARRLQVLVVTHSPQVAARGDGHWRIVKGRAGQAAVTRVEALSPEQRREEIARMLAGAQVTPEARAAADSLLRHSRTTAAA
jgi:DNA repair protein RecN (Recombination protein N)